MRARDLVADIKKMFADDKDERKWRYVENRPKLTLRKLNAVRKMREVQKAKRLQQQKLVQKMYSEIKDDEK